MIGIGCLIYCLIIDNYYLALLALLGFVFDILIYYIFINNLHYEQDEELKKVLAYIGIEIVIGICIIISAYIIIAICIIAMGIFMAGCIND